MKFIHISDVHLGRRPVGNIGDYSNRRFQDYFDSFNYAINVAIEKNVDAIIISGDFFDRREISPEILQRAELSLSRLKECGIKTILIEGNHDNITFGSESDSWIIYLSKKALLIRPYYYFNSNEEYVFVPIEIENCRFYGLGYPGSFAKDVIYALSEQIVVDDNITNIVIMHTAIAADELVSGTVDSEAINLLCNKADYIAGGHLHSYRVYPKDEPYFFIPGSLEYFDLREIGQKKGFILFDTSTKKHEWFESKNRDAVHIKINSKSDDFNQLLVEFEELVNSSNLSNDCLVYCEIKLNNSFYIDSDRLKEMLQLKGALKSSIRIIFPNSSISDFSSSNLTIEQIEKKIISSWETFSSKVDLAANKIKKLKDSQSDNNFDVFYEEFDNLFDTLINVNN